MTATAAPVLSSPRPAPVSRMSRWLMAALLPIGPAVIAVLRLVMPYNTTDDSATIVAKVAAHQQAQSLIVWLGFAGLLTLVPAVLWVARLTRPAAPRTTTAALVLLVPGYLALGLLVAADAALLSGVRDHVDFAVLARQFDGSHPTAVIADAIFVAGHVAGTVLLGVALWLSRVVPRWAAVATIVAQPLHFVAAVILASHPLDFAAWGLNAVGFAVAAIALVRSPDPRA
ncbi:hypothetical protein [Labedaea rhizosphaerae]|uniref:DUF4386 domain-containing protein n=1 Tax=Labedaea rhizosphaerae TaxID=598644 RepID=A0A4R6S681_LABRH|nr:hypothetical protein [Labedaea rhizosphaerae]TDP94853.1 hypothetical protein EV186_10585 [Labedaea rhizosphaerae]